MSENVFSITEITRSIRKCVEGSFPRVAVEGEISNYRPNASGHLYFTLKDEGAQLPAVMFSRMASSLGFSVKDGMKVQATGRITVYEPHGRYQMVIDKMSISGEGDILRLIEERKRRLADEGLFAEENKKRIPRLPKTVGVVTSPTGAAIRDILNIARRRNPGIDVVVLPAQVQGDAAARTIAAQIRTANAFRMCDVLIVGRGGGSLEDLMPFSEEEVVRAIAESEIPILSAVGHEIDWALSDYAADMRAPTPSAAAELVFPLREELLDEVGSLSDSLVQGMEQIVSEAKIELRSFDGPSMEIYLKTLIQPLEARIENSRRTLSDTIEEIAKSLRQRIGVCSNTLEVANPENVLKRGFAVVATSDGKIIRNPGQVKDGEIVGIRLAEGQMAAKVFRN